METFTVPPAPEGFEWILIPPIQVLDDGRIRPGKTEGILILLPIGK